MCSWRARLLALATAVTLLMPASALAQVVYLCTMTGTIGSKCCCAAAKQEARKKAPRGDAVERPDCCEELQAAEQALASSIETMPSVGPAVLVSTLSVADLVDLGGSNELVGAPQARGPPGLGPPIYLENCSLLR